eukprot:7333198-Alexandrium_andersonii.AAC.1
MAPRCSLQRGSVGAALVPIAVLVNCAQPPVLVRLKLPWPGRGLIFMSATCNLCPKLGAVVALCFVVASCAWAASLRTGSA